MKNENRELDTLPLFVRIVISTLSVIFALGILFNTLVLINAHLEKYDYATAFGFSPIAVMPPADGSPPDIVEGGDLLFAIERGMQKYEVGDPVAYWANGTLLIGEVSYIEGDPESPTIFVRAAFSEQSYATPATESNLLGEIVVRIPYLGYFVLFLTTLLGRILFVGIPFLIYLILLLLEIRRERLEEAEWEGDLPEPEWEPRRRVAVFARTAKQMRRYAPWAFLMTAAITVAAIHFGTSESRRIDKQAKKLAKAQRADSAFSLLPTPQSEQFVQPKKLRSVRAVRAMRPRATRPATRISPRGGIRGRL